ncbi:cell wall hydrolase [Halarsenatibacter silvermanii]|uniref:cell wall hydrolase n=1 Tax=Halarsenatibacter silvermanii TaxID=321763 RepID=UPI001F2DF837|nr:cell wall hydrolase [Halarsenatibacter silvermanii]
MTICGKNLPEFLPGRSAAGLIGFFTIFMLVVIMLPGSLAAAEEITLLRTAERETGELALLDYREEVHYLWPGDMLGGYELVEVKEDHITLQSADRHYRLFEDKSLPRAKSVLEKRFYGQSTYFAIDLIARENLEPGDRGREVVFLQHILYQTDFLDSHPGGYFDGETEAAVKEFQEEFDLEGEGKVTASTWARLKLSDIPGLSGSRPGLKPEVKPIEISSDEEVPEGEIAAPALKEFDTVSEEEFELFTRIINGEARGEPFQGKVAVGAVVVNRVNSSRFPRTITQVIYDQAQFSPIQDGSYRLPPSQESREAAREAIKGSDPTDEALYFYNPRIATDYDWVENKERVTTIGGHEFLR